MKKISILDRILLLITGLLAAYQIAVGIDGTGTLAMSAYTVSFGVLLVAGLLLIILGFDILDSPLVVIISTIIPLSLSLGLVYEYLPSWGNIYTIFVIIGFLLVIYSRYKMTSKLAFIPIALVHGVSGMIIFLLPIIYSIQGKTPNEFVWVTDRRWWLIAHFPEIGEANPVKRHHPNSTPSLTPADDSRLRFWLCNSIERFPLVSKSLRDLQSNLGGFFFTPLRQKSFVLAITILYNEYVILTKQIQNQGE